MSGAATRFARAFALAVALAVLALPGSALLPGGRSGGAARADDAVGGLSASRLIEEARTLEQESVTDPAKDRERWEAVRARTTSFLDRFPDDPGAKSMALLHAVSALRLGRADDAVRDATGFLDRHGDGDSRATGLYLRGLAHAERAASGADAAALADFAAALEAAAGADDFAARVRSARAQVHIRAGDHAAAIEELRALVASLPQGTPLARRAEQDLAEQVQVGGQPPPLAELEAAKAARGVVVVVLRRAGEPVGEALLAEARAAVAASTPAPTAPAPAAPEPPSATAPPAAGAEVIDLVVAGFGDARVTAFKAPALPRAYVLGPRGRLWVIRAAGVRGEAIGRAVAEP